MGHDLESPGTDEAPNWESLYRARGDEVVPHRPIFTGDVFEKVTVFGPEVIKNKTIMVLQHPCALRTNGVDLVSRILVAEIRKHKIIPPSDWTRHVAKLPLAELIPTVETGTRNQAVFFDEIYLTRPSDLKIENRIACLSQAGVNLLLQRWVNHNSRAVIPTFTYQGATSPVLEEADLIEYWSEERIEDGLSIRDAAAEAVDWLRKELTDGSTRQQRLKNPQNRSTIRREMRTALRELRTASNNTD